MKIPHCDILLCKNCQTPDKKYGKGKEMVFVFSFIEQQINDITEAYKSTRKA
jgi:hypothetical protein